MFKRKDKFSFRKFKTGLGSIYLGAALLTTVGVVTLAAPESVYAIQQGAEIVYEKAEDTADGDNSSTKEYKDVDPIISKKEADATPARIYWDVQGEGTSHIYDITKGENTTPVEFTALEYDQGTKLRWSNVGISMTQHEDTAGNYVRVKAQDPVTGEDAFYYKHKDALEAEDSRYDEKNYTPDETYDVIITFLNDTDPADNNNLVTVGTSSKFRSTVGGVTKDEIDSSKLYDYTTTKKGDRNYGYKEAQAFKFIARTEDPKIKVEIVKAGTETLAKVFTANQFFNIRKGQYNQEGLSDYAVFATRALDSGENEGETLSLDRDTSPYPYKVIGKTELSYQKEDGTVVNPDSYETLYKINSYLGAGSASSFELTSHLANNTPKLEEGATAAQTELAKKRFANIFYLFGNYPILDKLETRINHQTPETLAYTVNYTFVNEKGEEIKEAIAVPEKELSADKTQDTKVDQTVPVWIEKDGVLYALQDPGYESNLDANSGVTSTITSNATEETLSVSEAVVRSTKTTAVKVKVLYAPASATDDLPYKTTYISDSSKPYGTPNETVTEGKNGATYTAYRFDDEGNAVAYTKTVAATDEVIKVFTGEKVETEEVPFETTYVFDDSKDYGYKETTTPGEAGETTTTTTYSEGPDFANTGTVVASDPTTVVTKEKTDQVITVGGKPTVETTTTPYDTIYEIDESGDTPAGTQTTVQEGVEGKTTKTTTYKKADDFATTGNVVANDPTTETLEKQDKIVKVSAPKKVEETPIDFETEYVEDPELEAGQQVVTQEGVNGKTTTTTTYSVDPKTGAVTENTPTTETTQPVKKIVKVGTKPKVENKELPYTTKYVTDDSLDNGQKETETPGETGTETTTTTYTLDKTTGQVTENEPTTEITKEPVQEVIKVGVKPKVTKEEVPFDTLYEEDPEGDKGVETVVTEGETGEKTTTTTYKKSDDFDTTGNTEEDQTTTETTKEKTDKVVKVGVKPTKEETPIPFETEYVEDPTLEAGQQVVAQEGVNGKTTKTTTYSVDPKTGEVTENTPTTETTQPVKKIVKVGTKPKVENKELPYTTKYVTDDSLDNGQKETETPGETGTETTTTTYTLDKTTGQVTPNEPTTEITKEPVQEVIKVGVKPKVTKEDLPFDTIYEEDPEGDKGVETVVTEGETGEKTTTTTYKKSDDFDTTGNTEEDQTTTETTKEKTDKVVKVGVKPTKEETPIPFETEYVEDPELEAGQQVVEQEGEEGTETKTTTYTLDKTTGEVTENTPTTETTKQPVKKIVKVGTKPKVTTEEIPYTTTYKTDDSLDNGDKETETPGEKGTKTTTTTYTVDPKTGEVTEKTTTETTKEPVEEVIKVGTKPKVTKEEVPFDTIYEEDPEGDKGVETVVTEGETGEKTTTTTYKKSDDFDTTGNTEEDQTTTETTKEKTDKVVKVGVKPTKEETPIPFETEYVEDPTLEAGQEVVEQEGEEGTETKTTTYTLDKTTGEVTENTPTTETTKQPVKKIVKVGTKPKVTTEEIPYTTTYKTDDSLDNGDKETETPGEKGTKTTTTTYTVDPKTGEVTEKTTTETTKEPVEEVIKVGTKPKVTKEDLPFDTIYEEDPEGDKGVETVVTEGETGEKTTTTTYKKSDDFDTTGNTEEDQTTTETTKEKTDKVVKVGVKPTKEETPIPFETEYVEDPTLEAGQEVVEQEGEEGTETKTTTYTLDKTTGEVTENTPTTETTKQPVKKIVKVGTKPKVVTEEVPFETIYKGDDSLEKGQTETETPGEKGSKTTTTTYTVDPKTGEVTEKTTTEDKDPVTEVIKVGNKPTVEKTPIPFETEYVDDPTLEEGQEVVSQEGKEGEETTTTTYTLDPKTGQVTPNEPTSEVTTEPVKKIIKRGTKKPEQPTTGDKTPIPVEVTYVPNENEEPGKQTVENPGKEGEKDKDGNVITPMDPKVISVGTKPSVDKTPVPFETEYVDDPTLEEGQEVVSQEGKEGEKTTTTTYTLDPKTGQVTPNEPTSEVTTEPVKKIIKRGTKKPEQPTTGDKTPIPVEVTYVPNENEEPGKQTVENPGKEGEKDKDGNVITPMEPKVISVGTKPSVDKTPVPFETEYVDDPTLEEGQEVVSQEGKEGEKTTTTTYTLDPKTGQVTPNEPTSEVTTEPVKKIIKRGTKKPSTPTPEVPTTEIKVPVGTPITEGDVEKHVQIPAGGKITKIGTIPTTETAGKKPSVVVTVEVPDPNDPSKTTTVTVEVPVTVTPKETPNTNPVPVIETDLTGKAGTKTPITVTNNLPGSVVTLFDKAGNVIGTGVADKDGVVVIIPDILIPEGNVTATYAKDGVTSEISNIRVATKLTSGTNVTPNPNPNVKPTPDTNVKPNPGTNVTPAPDKTTEGTTPVVPGVAGSASSTTVKPNAAALPNTGTKESNVAGYGIAALGLAGLLALGKRRKKR